MSHYDLVIANDHAGFNLKIKIIKFLENKHRKQYLNIVKDNPVILEPQRQIRIHDCGSYSLESVDYPDFAKEVVKEILQKKAKYGMLICGSGIGMSITANRNPDIRAALCLDEVMAKLARAHNNANVLVLASRLTDFKTAKKIIENFLNTDFEGGRHLRRIAKIN